ncbi:hypothetical protein D915_004037 [Fasciola hepatica]|uniref:N-acetylmuramoyl-L-alanine amidase n=1 Tax=Fasciola hepatica TaxID=6192 RepID=A0A4E0REG7_FASHE|nr:hypothetical protein D915_004037 [Fasciola hepatica]
MSTVSVAIKVVVFHAWLYYFVYSLSMIYEQPVNRCMGEFELTFAEPVVDPTNPEGTVLDRLTDLPPGSDSCRMACILYEDCWAAHHVENKVNAETCILYPHSGVQLSPNGVQMFVWRCKLEQLSCTYPNADRCPGFWTLTISLQVIMQELKAMNASNSISAPGNGKCTPTVHSGIEFQACLAACENNRQCTVFQYRPEAQDNSNRSIPSACTLLDENAVYPTYNEFRVWWKPKMEPVFGKGKEVKLILLSIPTKWIFNNLPGQLRWTCCKKWWELLDFRAHEKQMKQIACTPTEPQYPRGVLLCAPTEPSSIAGLARKCTWHGYWSLYRHSYGVANEFQSTGELVSVINKTFSGFDAQVVNSSGTDVLVVGRFYTQNPLDCVRECANHPCCLGPMYLLKKWTCILFGAFVGPPVCTSKMENNFEWGTVSPVRNRELLETPFLLWQYECCATPSLLRDQFVHPAATVNNVKKNPFHPQQLGHCLCEESLVDKVHLISGEDLLCSENGSCKFDYGQKYAISPVALFVDRLRPVVVYASGMIQGYYMDDSIWEKSRSKEINGNIWIPVLSNLYSGQNLWAGPWTHLRGCPLLNCRVHLDNRISATSEPNPLGDDNVKTPDLKLPIIRAPRDWHEPTCTNRGSFQFLNLSQPLRHIIIHNTYIPRYRCYTYASCVHYIRQAALYHLSKLWYGIGYNYIIGNDGIVYEGRGAGFQGAHTGGFNAMSYGITFIGWYQFSPPAIEALSAFSALIRDLLNRGFIEPDVSISGFRDIRIGPNPGDSLHNWIQTLPKWVTNQSFSHYNEVQCKLITYEDNYWLIPSSSITVACLLLVAAFAFLVHYLYTLSRIKKNLRTGNFFGPVQHTSECQEWSAVCTRVNNGGRLFRVVRLRPPAQGKLLREGISRRTGTTEEVSQFGAEHTGSLERSGLSEFLAAYIRPVQVNIMLAMFTKYSESKEQSVPHFSLFLLFCQSWKEVLDRYPVNPPLIFFSLSALYKYQLTVLKTTPDFCVELLTDSLDFLIVVDTFYEATQHEAHMRELCLNCPTIVKRHYCQRYNNLCARRAKVGCSRCCACQSLKQTWDREPTSQNFQRTICNFLQSKTRRLNKFEWQVDPQCWFRFHQDQEEYATLPQLIEGHISSYLQFLVHEESRHAYEHLAVFR